MSGKQTHPETGQESTDGESRPDDALRIGGTLSRSMAVCDGAIADRLAETARELRRSEGSTDTAREAGIGT